MEEGEAEVHHGASRIEIEQMFIVAACMYSTLLFGKHFLRMGVEMKKFIRPFPNTEDVCSLFLTKVRICCDNLGPKSR